MSNSDHIIKRCLKCGFQCSWDVAPEHFSRDKARSDGLRVWCKNCIRAYNNAWNAAHRTKTNEYAANYRTKHREELRAEARIYWDEHRDERRVYRVKHSEERRAYRAQNKAAGKIYNHTRRARKNSGGTFTTDELDAVLKAHTNSKKQLICALCGQPIEGKYHIDHFIPLKLGGTNEAGNLRVTHVKCNLKKAATHPHKLGKLI